MSVLLVDDINSESLIKLLAHFGLQLESIAHNQTIPGSYWGEPEAGIIGETIYARSDTPIHSVLHEACHVIVADPQRRSKIHTNASDCVLEEDATCYLQILLADYLPGVGMQRMMQDMDEWGYTFRLGSAQRWFVEDTQETQQWLQQKGILPLSI